MPTRSRPIRASVPCPPPRPPRPPGCNPLALLTVDPDGTLGLYRDGRGWLAEGSVDGNAQRPTFIRNAGRLLILRVANENLEALDPDTGQAVIALNWAALTGQADFYFYGAYPSPDNSAALAFVFQRAGAFAPYGLFRVDLSTQAVEELLPVGSWASLQGPPGSSPRYVVTPTGHPGPPGRWAAGRGSGQLSPGADLLRSAFPAGPDLEH